MIVNNPFLFITPRLKDSLIGRKDFVAKIKSTIMKSLDDKAIVVVSGDFGIGKSLFVEKVILDLKSKKNLKIYSYDFNFNILNDLRALPSEKKSKKQFLVVIDKFDLILSLSSMLQKKILNIMADLCEAKVTFIISSTAEVLNKVKGLDLKIKKYFKVLNVPSMNFEETKELILSRLNEVRPKKSDSLHPFTLDEVKEIYKNSKGNPRIILMLCAGLFEEKF